MASPLMQADAAAIATRIEAVISAAAERIHYAEGRRTNYATMGGVLIAAGVAMFTFAWGAIEQVVLRMAATGSAVSMFLVGAFILFIYGIQTNRYAYTSATKTWKWFYRDALPNDASFELRRLSYYSGIGWKSHKESISHSYASALPNFVAKIHALSDNETNLAQDIEQLYSLHLNEKYKNAFLSDIRNVFNSGLIFIMIATLIGSAGGLYLHREAQLLRVYTKLQNSNVIHAEGKRLTSPLSPDAQLSMRLIVVNPAKTPLRPSGIQALDKDGWPLPIELKIFGPVSPIKPSQRVELFGVASGKSRVVDRVHAFRAELN